LSSVFWASFSAFFAKFAKLLASNQLIYKYLRSRFEVCRLSTKWNDDGLKALSEK
jgi:hypothetical protein